VVMGWSPSLPVPRVCPGPLTVAERPPQRACRSVARAVPRPQQIKMSQPKPVSSCVGMAPSDNSWRLGELPGLSDQYPCEPRSSNARGTEPDSNLKTRLQAGARGRSVGGCSVHANAVTEKELPGGAIATMGYPLWRDR
jgi:hypothetical protein